jgi:hypothetical protein
MPLPVLVGKEILWGREKWEERDPKLWAQNNNSSKANFWFMKYTNISSPNKVFTYFKENEFYTCLFFQNEISCIADGQLQVKNKSCI